ncbi:MAG: ArsR family transcriptional regulator [Candidatus Heimdallarchaeota archaeon]|nr:ArsR family transcriptional regulator [Candidatus Heimdallarchaeota archaeon]MCK5048553.1 ArsR family transcriptional regulator [Candidatus Heimdallarchaeota archaeon]
MISSALSRFTVLGLIFCLMIQIPSGEAATSLELYEPTEIFTRSVILTWSESNDWTFEKYELFQKEASSNTYVSIASILEKENCTYTVTGLEPTTRYYFFVRDVDALGHKDSNIISVTTAILEDQDKDGLADVEEESLGTNVTNPDTDGDQCYDGWEVDMGLDPLNPLDGYYDNDGDGLLNYQEFGYHTDPFDKDTDGDGYSDGDEIDFGSDPNDRWSNKLIKRLIIIGITVLIAAVVTLGVFIYIKKRPKVSKSTELAPLMKLNSLNFPQTFRKLEEGFVKYNKLLLEDELQKRQPHLKSTPYEIYEKIDEPIPEIEEQGPLVTIEPIESIEVEEKATQSEQSKSYQETVVISTESYEIFNELNGVMVRILILLLFELPISLPNQVIVERLNLSPVKVSRSLKKLEKLGLVISTTDVVDTRLKINRLVGKGTNILHNLYQMLNSYYY